MLPKRKQIPLMGTVIDLTIWHKEADSLLSLAESWLHHYRKVFSANDSDSDLMAINQAAGKHPVFVKPDLLEVIKLGKTHSLAPNSQLNIAIGPLVKLWRIGFADARVPSQREIEQKLTLTNPHDILIDEDTSEVFLKQAGMELDLGALAKGYIADQIVQNLQRLGAEAGFINLGGNVLTFGQAPHQADGFWRIGIQDPQKPRGQNLTVLVRPSGSVVTSGVYERRLHYQGKSYHHIFDPQTGYPMASDLVSLTICSATSIEGEIWTTRLFGRRSEDILAEIEGQDGLEGLLITDESKILRSSGLV